MKVEPEEIVIVVDRIDLQTLERLVGRHFESMVKYVVDVDRQVVAIGGAMHADAEEVLLEDGSRQPSLWGANYYPGRGPQGCIEFVSLINIRPRDGNHSMEIVDAALRQRVQEITSRRIGSGEEPGWPRSTAT